MHQANKGEGRKTTRQSLERKKMKKIVHNTKKNNKKTPRLSKAEQEKKRNQEASAEQAKKLLAAKETEDASNALEALRIADHKSAEHTYRAGKALGNIKNDKLYRAQGDKSFKAFVRDKFNISEQYAYMLIGAAEAQDILTCAGATTEHVSEKQLRKLTFLRKTEEGRARMVEIWKAATGNDPKAIPTDKALADAVMASKQKSKPTAAKNKIDSEILDDPDADAKDIIKLLRRVVDRKVRLGEDGLSKLRDRLNTICDNAEPSENND